MADPISAAVTAVVSYVGSAFAAAASGSATLAQAATVVAVNTAVSVGVGAIMAPDVGAGGSPTAWKSDPQAGIPFVAGRRGVAGNIVHRDEWGPDNRYQSFVTVYSGAGPVKSFGTFTADEAVQVFGSNERPTSGTWSDVMWMQRKLGAQPDTALTSPTDPTVSGTLPSWTTSHKLSGKACSMWTLAQNKARDRYAGNVPTPLQVIEGIYGYDPRLDSSFPGGTGTCRIDDRTTYVYITNPIIGGLNWAIGLRENGNVVGGIGDKVTPTLNGVDAPAFVVAANIADANGWGVSAAWSSKDDKHQVLLAFLQAGGAYYSKVAGKMSCVSRGAVKASLATISAKDTAGPVEIDTAAPRLSRINTIVPKCPLESHKWEMTPLDPVTEPAYVTEDGGQRERGIDYQFSSDAVQTSQLAAYDIVDSREGITGRVPLKPYLRKLKPGDAFTFDEPEFVLNNTKCMVLKRDFDPETMIVTITFRSETDSKHPYALGLSPTAPTPSALTVADPNTFPQPPLADWALAASTVEGPNGETSPIVVLTGAVTNTAADAVDVQIRHRLPDGSGGWLAWSAWSQAAHEKSDVTRIEIGGVPPGAQVQTQIHYISQFGIRSTSPREQTAVTVSGTQTVTDALVPSAAITAAAEAVDAARTNLAEALDALRDRFASGQPDGVQAFDAYKASLDRDVAAVLTAAEAGDDSIASRISRLEAPSNNLIADTWGRAGGNVNWIDGQTAPAVIAPQGTHARYRATYDADAAGVGPKLIYLPRKQVAVGEIYEASARIDIEGVATAPRLRLAIFNSETAGSPTQVITVNVTAGARDGSFAATIPAAGWARFEVEADSSGAGEGAIEIEGGLWRLADAGQSAISAAPSKDDVSLTFIKEIQAVTSRIAAQSQRLQASNDHALAEITNLVITQVDGGTALASQLNEVTAQVQGLESSISTLEQAVAGVATEAARISRLEVGAVLNRIPDPIFDNGSSDWLGDAGPCIIVSETNRFLRMERTATGAGDAGSVEHIPPIPVLQGQSIEWSPRVRMTGVTSSVSLRARFTDRDGVDISTSIGDSVSGAGWIEGLTFFSAPADGYIHPQIVAVASGAGDLTVDFDEPQIVGALDGQTTRTPFLRARSPQQAQLLEIQRVTGRAIDDVTRLQFASGHAQGQIVEQAILREEGDSLLAAISNQLRVDLTGVSDDLSTNHLTSAELALIYFTEAQTTAAIAGFNLALNATHSALDARVGTAEGDIAAVETDLLTNYYTSAAADLQFMTAAETDSSIAAFNLSLNATHSALDTRVGVAEGDITAVETDLLTNYYSSSESDLAFTNIAEVEAAIAVFNLDLNASFNGLSGTVSTHGAAISNLEGAAAVYEVLVAAGVDPAIVRLLSGIGGSEIQLAATVLQFWNTAGGGSAIKAMEVISGIVNILKELRLGDGAKLTHFDGVTLAALFGEKSPTEKGLFLFDPTTGDPLFTFDTESKVYRIETAMQAPGTVVSEGQGVLSPTTIWANPCSGGACTPVSTADYDNPIVHTTVVNGEPGAPYIVEALMRMTADSGIFKWLNFKHHLLRYDPTKTSLYGNAGFTDQEHHSASVSVNSVSGAMETANYPATKAIVAIATGNLPLVGDTFYNANGYTFAWKWLPDASVVPSCSDGVNRNSGLRDCKLSGAITAKVLKI